LLMELRDSLFKSSELLLPPPLLGDLRGSVTLIPVERSLTPLSGYGSTGDESSMAVFGAVEVELDALRRNWLRTLDLSSTFLLEEVVSVSSEPPLGRKRIPARGLLFSGSSDGLERMKRIAGLGVVTLFSDDSLGISGSSGVGGVGRNRIPPRGFGDKLLALLLLLLTDSDRSDMSESSEFCFMMPDILRSWRAFISANTLPPTPIPSFVGTADRLAMTGSSGESAVSGSLDVDPSRVLAMGDLAGSWGCCCVCGGDEDITSLVGDGLGFLPKMEDSRRTPIPRL